MTVSFPYQYLRDLCEFEVMRRTIAEVLASGMPLDPAQRDMYEGLSKLKLVEDFDELTKILETAKPDGDGLVHIPVA